jgi:N-acetylmuramoyl-L-alanine amidase
VSSSPVTTGSDNQAAKPTGKLARVTGIRHWSTTAYTRVAIDLEDEVQFEAGRVTNPDRIFFDLHGTRLAAEMKGKSFDVQDDGFLSKIRVAQFSNDMTRVVLNVSNISDYSAFLLPNPYRLIIDVHGKSAATQQATTTEPPTKFSGPPNSTSNIASKAVEMPPSLTLAAPVKLTKAQRNGTTKTHEDAAPANTLASVQNVAGVDAHSNAAHAMKRPTTAPVVVKDADSEDDDAAAANNEPATPATPQKSVAGTAKTSVAVPPKTNVAGTGKTNSDAKPVPPVAALLNPDNATQQATTKQGKKKSGGKPSAAVEKTRAGAPSSSDDGNDLSAMTRVTVPAETGAVTAGENAAALGGASSRPRKQQPEPTLTGAHEAVPTASGERSLVRALGLKIGRIVVDAGHGGHDVGTLGVDGIQEKDVVLDVALRLGKLLRQRLGSDVMYTRDDDTFIPLETRTAIANKAQADLFISIHANSSHDATARGVEVYYLNFTASPDALEVAARENAVSQNSIFQLSSLVKQITLRDKIEESREFAADVDASLFNGITAGNAGLKDRGVKKAPFVVLIGANMPSILAEISFVTNEDDARQLRDPSYRQRVAESLYRGVAKYANGLSGVRLAQNRHSGTNGE